MAEVAMGRTAGPHAGIDRRGGRLLFAMALASGITSVPNAAIVLALPVIHRHFNASLTELQWTVTGYLLTYSTLMIAAGRLADIFGRVRLITVGTLLYMGASIPAALAGNPTVLIAGLVVAGIGGAVLTPASLAIVTNHFRGPSRGMAVGVWGGSSALFSGIAPALGGLFTQEASWRWILWFNVIIGALILIGIRRAAESYDEEASHKVDVTGVALSFTGLAALVLAFNEAPTPWAFKSATFILVVVAAAMLLAGFVMLQRRLRDPLIDLALLLRRNVTGAIVVLFVLNFALGATLFFLPLYLEEQLGYGALKAGLALLPVSATMTVAMPLGGRLFERVGPVPSIVAGGVMSAIAMLLFAELTTGSSYGAVWPSLALLGLGIGTALTPLNLTALNATSVRTHGVVAGLLAMIAGLGGMFGVSLTGALFEQLQTRDTVQAAAGSGIHITDASARTLDGLMSGTSDATSALGHYPAGQHATLTDAVHHGFVSALSSGMELSFGLVVFGIVLTFALIRRRPAVEPLPVPNVTQPFSGLAPRP
jgi:EmrB/QacA subfamily drug resistance transporter